MGLELNGLDAREELETCVGQALGQSHAAEDAGFELLVQAGGNFFRVGRIRASGWITEDVANDARRRSAHHQGQLG